MASLIASRYRLLVVLLAVVLVGCETSGPGSVDDNQQLNRWLEQGTDETPGDQPSVPEQVPEPPRRVALESLTSEQEPLSSISDLTQLEYFSFELPRAAYVSVRVRSDAGAEISLMDRAQGVFASNGRAGFSDGRIDTLLDPGEYRVSVRTINEDENAQVSANEFVAVQADSALLMNSPPGTLHESELRDGQTASYWVRVTEDEPLVLEAMGRALRAVRIWKDGVWVTDQTPQVHDYSPLTGRSMGYTQISGGLEPGDYLLTFYGGPERVWQEEGTGSPFYVRSGAKYLDSVIDAQTEISPMGRDAFLVSGDATVFEVENSDFVPVQIGISRYGTGQDRYRPISTASVESTDDSTRSRGAVSRSSSPRWIFVEGTPGDTVRIRAIPQRREYTIDEPTSQSRYLISTVSTLDADHAMDASVMIVRDATRTTREEIISSHSLEVTDTPLVRELNLFQPVYIFVNLHRSGQWAIVHDGTEDSPVAAALIPLRELFSIGNPDIVTDNPAGFDMERGEHLLMLQPSRPGLLKFALYYRGVSTAAADRRAAALLDDAAPAPRQDITYVTEPGEIAAGVDHTVEINERGGPESALFVSRLPLDLAESVPLTLAAGQEIQLPVSPTGPGAISTGYDSISVLRNGEPLENGELLPQGRSTLTLTNEGNSTTTFVLRLSPVFTPSYTSPRIPAIEDTLPILTPGPAVFHDYDRNQTRQFLLVVDEPGFYQLQTTGRLATRISTRTPANPRGHSFETNGPGRNALVQAYFRSGTYLVNVGPLSQSAGRAGLIMAPLPMHDLGRMSEGAWYRTELDPGVALRSTAIIQSDGEYGFESFGLHSTPGTRLEDADQWPVQGTTLRAGAYTFVAWPETVWNRRLTRYIHFQGASAQPDGEPWMLGLNTTMSRVWTETPNRTPQQFVTFSPASIPVTVQIPSQLEWWVTDDIGNTVAEGQGAQSFELVTGENTFNVRSREENNDLQYRISLSTPVLSNGLAQSLNGVPRAVPVIIERAGIYEFWSMGRWDVRAALSSEDGEQILAEGDDRPGDWNFYLSRYLPAGTYSLNVSDSFPGSGYVTVHCQLRDEVWVETQQMPLDTALELDQTIVGIPFRTGRADEVIRVTTDEPVVHLAIYRDETLVAEGRNELFVPIAADQEYLLRIRNDSLNTTAVELLLQAPELAILEWDGATPLDVPAGAVAISNPGGVAAVASAGSPQPVLSGVVERAATEPGEGVVANPAGTLWSWNAGPEPVQILPLVVQPGPSAAFDLTDDDVAALLPSSPATISVLAIRSVAGHIGAMAVPPGTNTPTRDWSTADVGLSSTILGVSGGNTHQIWLWDGDPRTTGRRVELASREFGVEDPIRASDLDSFSLAPGSAVAVSIAGSPGIQILLSPNLVAFAEDRGQTVWTAAARSANRSATLPGAETLYVVNTGTREGSARILPATAVASLEVTPSEGMEATAASGEAVTARVQPDRAAGAPLGIWAVNPAEIVLLTDSGRRVTARPPNDAKPYWSLPGLSGELQVMADPGPVAVWPDGTEGVLPWVARDTGRALPLATGSSPMATAAQRWVFQLDREMFVLASTENRGVTILDPGGGQEDLAPQVAIGSGDSRRVFAVLGEGEHTLYTRPMAGEPQPNPLRFQTLEPIPISELTDPQTLFVGAEDRMVFEVNVRDDAAVGIGLETETDEFSTFLMDSQLRIIGSGRIYYRDLAEGRYYLLVENGSQPMTVRPVVLADQGSRTGVPEQVIDSYRGN